MTALIIYTPIGEYIMFRALALNLPTVMLSLAATALLALFFAVIAINRTYSHDTSEIIRK